MTEEVWKPVAGYEGKYDVSTLGRIRDKKGRTRKQYRQRGTNTWYLAVSMTKDGVTKTRKVHKVVAETFIPNPDKLPVINHKDEDGTNNNVDNLEWCTHSYNRTYGSAVERQAAKLRGHINPHAYKVEAFGETHTYREWAEIYGITTKAIDERLRHGWSAERAVSTPLMRNGSSYIDGRLVRDVGKLGGFPLPEPPKEET